MISESGGTITYSTTASSSVGTVNSNTGKVMAKGVGTIKVYATAGGGMAAAWLPFLLSMHRAA